jgi:heme/copper-type cytochrome/quinol oxidase subunit 1
MTLTAAPHTSAAIDKAAFGDLASTGETWLTTTDHRKIGGLLAGASLLVGLVGTLMVGLVGWKFDTYSRGALSESGFLNANPEGGWSYDRFLNATTMGLPMFVIAPLFLAIITIAVPRLIGSSRMAFPRLQAFVLWGYVVAVALLVAAFTVVDGPPLWNAASRSWPSIGASNHASDLLSGAFGVLGVVLFAGAVNTVATVLTQRRPGLQLENVAPFAWASLLAGGVTVLSIPAMLGGLVMSAFSMHVESNLLVADGFSRIWFHTMYVFGRPDAFVPVLLALGIASQIVSNRAGKPLIGGVASKILMTLFAALSFGVWATSHLPAMIQPTSNIVSGLVAVPAGLLVLVWLGTLAKGVKPDASLLFVVGLIVLLGLGAVNVIVAAARGVSSDLPDLWTIGQTLLLIVAAPLAAALGGLLEFAPGAWGRKVAAPLTGLVGLAALGGGVFLAVGLAGVAYKTVATDKALPAAIVAGLGGFLLAGAIALTVLNLLGSIVAGKGELIDGELMDTHNAVAIEGAN